MPLEFNPNNEIKKSSLEVLKRRMWKALLVGSSALMFQACEPTRAEIDAMPKTSIEELNKHPELFSEHLIKTEGYIEDLGEKKTTAVEVYPSIDGEGNATIESSIVIKYEHSYNLRESIDVNSTHVAMATVEDFPSKSKYPPKDKFEIVGTVRQKDGKHVIFIVNTFDLTTAVPEKKE